VQACAGPRWWREWLSKEATKLPTADAPSPPGWNAAPFRESAAPEKAEAARQEGKPQKLGASHISRIRLCPARDLRSLASSAIRTPRRELRRVPCPGPERESQAQEESLAGSMDTGRFLVLEESRPSVSCGMRATSQGFVSEFYQWIGVETTTQSSGSWETSDIPRVLLGHGARGVASSRGSSVTAKGITE